jgi:hypothetical protein
MIPASTNPIMVSYLPYPGLMPITIAIKNTPMVMETYDGIIVIKELFNANIHPIIANINATKSILRVMKGSVYFL